MVENLISSGIEDHTFGPINLREHFNKFKSTSPVWMINSFALF